ncbi:MAG: hypothetical protein NVV62_05490 [Terricaulis sp.]|nr:hypothetical protein [Terricaulis sp.]
MRAPAPRIEDFGVEDDLNKPAPRAAEPDPSLDEELEIPAFLRRQINPR